jgi:hypothetical protein
MKFETVNQDQVTFVSRQSRSSKYDELFLSLKALEEGKCVVIKIDEGKSINKIKQNITQALRNHDLDTFKVSVLQDESGVAISRKENKNE